MSVAIVGAGLVTPFGDTPTEHAFFLRASVPAPPPSPFRLRSDGSALHVRYCRGIGAAAPIERRLTRMVDHAVRNAMQPCASLHEKGAAIVMLCVPKERPGVSEETLRLLGAGSASHGTVRHFSGDAGAFAALREAPDMLQRGSARVVVVVAVDSFIAIDALDQQVLHAPSEWNLDPPAPSEGAAAIVLAQAPEARRDAVAILGSLEAAAVVLGRSNDDNDEPVDGSAMTAVLRELPTQAPAVAAYGPYKVDMLRQDEWHLATARNTERFATGCRFACLESHVGRLGAASGLANLVYGLAVHRHRAGPALEPSDAPFYAWAVSPDGTRGAAVLAARESRG